MGIYKIIKIVSLVLFSLSICLLSYKICSLIAEKYFFDKFFYQKSIKYGYFNEEISSPNIYKYGNRAKDITNLQFNNQNIFGSNDKDTFKIAVIGDSYTWGNGLKNNQRFVKFLSKKLNKVRKTKIVSLAFVGWNILDYLNTFQQLDKNASPDLIMFALVTNDILINESDLSSSIVKQCQQTNNNVIPVYSSDYESNAQNESYDTFINKAWSNHLNQCILDNSLKILPTSNTIYFLTEDYEDNWSQIKSYRQHLDKNQKYILSSNSGKYISKYVKYWNNPWKSFTISPSEGHPNALANQMYADILFNEITTNPKWNFTQQ